MEPLLLLLLLLLLLVLYYYYYYYYYYSHLANEVQGTGVVALIIAGEEGHLVPEVDTGFSVLTAARGRDEGVDTVIGSVLLTFLRVVVVVVVVRGEGGGVGLSRYPSSSGHAW